MGKKIDIINKDDLFNTILESNAKDDLKKDESKKKGEAMVNKKKATSKKPLDLRGKEILELKKTLKKAKRERDQIKDQYLRALAEIDNQRKRMQKEKEEYKKFILRDFLRELLEVYDNLDRALQIKPKSKEGGTLLSGVEMTYNQLVSILRKYNVEEINALNQPFDPNYHQALTKIEKKGIREDTIIEVFQKGFTYNDRLLRPTLAKVAVVKED